MRKHTRLALLGLLLAAVPSAAQAQAIDPVFERDITRLLDVTGAAKIGEQLALIVSQQMSAALRQQRPDIPPRALAIVDDTVKSTLSEAFRTPGGLITRLVPIYARHFTHDEVRGLLAFYETPLGRKAVAVLPQLALDGAEAGQAWAAEMLPGLQAYIQRRLKAEGLIR